MKSLLVRLTLGLDERDMTDEERTYVQSWREKGFVVCENGRCRLPSQYRAGTVAMHQKGNGAWLQVLGTDVRDIFLDEADLNGAEEGDLVIARRRLGRRGTPGSVVAIVGRAESYSVAYVKRQNGVPSLVDIRTGHPAGVEIAPDELARFGEGSVFQIDNRNRRIAQTLGKLDDPFVDEKIVLAMYNKHDAFDATVEAAARAFDPVVHAEDFPDRTDLRHLPFCTIDPVTAKDFDDAVCYLPDTHTLYVAIADVSHYVTPYGPIDAEAIYRGFSIYLPHRSIPMLPRALSETLCSLQPEKDRLAYVFKLVLDPTDFSVAETELFEAVIHSRRRFTYEEVDAFFEGRFTPRSSGEQAVCAYLPALRELTDALREKRLETGFDFRSEELEMELDDRQNIVATRVAEETPSHALIEDCMLLANKAAASMFERGIFRIHEPPSPAKLQSLFAELAGIGIFVEQQESLKATISAIREAARARGLEHEVDTLIIRAQQRARYAPDNVGHFGLGFERYTHFTSPIRRYSDLVVHRLLKAIQAGDTEEGSYVLRNIDALCYAVSDKEREAADIELRFMDRKFARWANERLGQSVSARIRSTDPELRGESFSPLRGVPMKITASEALLLFDDIEARLETADLATAAVTATALKLLERHAAAGDDR